METHEFEVGQWVIGWHYPNPEFTSKPWKIQKIERGFIYPEGYIDYNTAVEYIKPFEPHSYYSVGDTVKITAKRSDDSRMFDGMYKKITEVNDYYIEVEDGIGGLHFNEVEKVEFKTGDIVVITEYMGGDPVGTITEIIFEETPRYIVKDMSGRSLSNHWRHLTGTLRHATPEEIEEYNRPKLPAINEYKGKDNGDTLKYGCAELNKSWFTKSANRSIKSMVLDSGVEINSEQIEKIRKYLG